MTKKKHQARIELEKEANEIMNEMLEGEWDHIPDIKNRPLKDLAEIFEELKNRMPGFDNQKYVDAFIRCYLNNR